MLHGKNVQKIADVSGGAIGAQPGFQFQLGSDVGGSLVIEFGTTGSVMLEGRISPDAPWVDLFTTNQTEPSKGVAVGRVYPEMRLQIDANGSTIKAWVMA